MSTARKLQISQPADVHEVAAERVAERVMQSGSGRTEDVGSTSSAAVSRLAKDQSALPTYGTLPFDVGSAQSLDPGVQTGMQARFGADFSGVRVHTGSLAAAAASSVNARAFTSGRSIVFGEGQYQPSSQAGQRLIAHELAHVVQTSSKDRIDRAALPFDSTIEIHHNLLRSRDFELDEGEGIVVRIAADWYSDDETTPFGRRTPVGPDKEGERWRGLRDDYSTSLARQGFLMDSRKGSADMKVSHPSRGVLKTDKSGTHHVLVNVFDHNHNFYLYGPIQVDKASADELREAPGANKDPTASEIVHDVLALAGLVPALGIVPDAADAVIYAFEGEWAQAGISAAAMIPILGQGATVVKLGGRTAVKVSKTAAKRLERRTAAVAIRETRSALKLLRTPATHAHFRNAGSAIDAPLVALAREARISQAGVTRAAFKEFNVASAKIRIGDGVEYVTAGNSPRKMMHSEDWILSQVQDLKRRNPGVKVYIDQLYSERIPCPKCMEKLANTNAELFYTVREYGSRAADLMKAYGL